MCGMCPMILEASLSNFHSQVMQKNALQWMELFLHFADVSNPLKPFPAGASGLPSNLENEFRYTYIIMYIYIYMLPPKKNQRFQTNFLLVCM